MLRGAQLELRMLVLLVLLSVVLSLISPYFFTLNLDRQVFRYSFQVRSLRAGVTTSNRRPGLTSCPCQLVS